MQLVVLQLLVPGPAQAVRIRYGPTPRVYRFVDLILSRIMRRMLRLGVTASATTASLSVDTAGAFLRMTTSATADGVHWH